MSSVSCLRCFQNLSEIISGWLALEEERFWARPTSTKVGTELGTKVGTVRRFCLEEMKIWSLKTDNFENYFSNVLIQNCSPKIVLTKNLYISVWLKPAATIIETRLLPLTQFNTWGQAWTKFQARPHKLPTFGAKLSQLVGGGEQNPHFLEGIWPLFPR